MIHLFANQFQFLPSIDSIHTIGTNRQFLGRMEQIRKNSQLFLKSKPSANFFRISAHKLREKEGLQHI
jgi:hypothetical protein